MLAGGCDIGSLTSKAVLMNRGRIVGAEIIKSKPEPGESAQEVMERALAKGGYSFRDISFCVGTGYGREKIPFVQETVSEIACHARGARWLVPSARTVIDIGGQDCKAMRISIDGTMEKFITNDKCASGTGRFLEVMAEVLGVSLEELGHVSSSSKNPVVLASACTVWAQADVIRHLNENVPLADIAAGINNAMASRMAIIANNIGIKKDVCMTGGVAKNAAVVAALEKILGVRVKRIRKSDPQIAGAIGAALLAEEKISGGPQ